MKPLATALCAKWPPHLLNAKPAMLRPDLSDADVDAALAHIRDLEHGCFKSARTQYGRRIQVDQFMRFEDRKSRTATNHPHEGLDLRVARAMP